MVCESDPHHAEARFNALPYANTAHVVRATAVFARALHQCNPTPAAEAYLTQARAALLTSTDLHDRLILADVLAEFGQHEAAVAIYEKDVSTTTDTPSLREYLRSLMLLNRRRRATEVLASLPPQWSGQVAYESLCANLAIVSGDYRAARFALERCFTVEPNNVTLRLLWADVCLRLEDPEPARQWLSAVNPRSPELTLDELRRLGRLLKALGEHTEAATALYEALRRFPHDPKAHTAFCSTVLFKGSPAWRPKAPGVAEVDTAVRLRDAEGVEKLYILEDRPEAELLLGEIAIASELGKRLLGRQPGDRVVGYASAYAVHETTVVSIEHKFVHALQASMAAFNTRFPEQSGLVSVKMPLSGPEDERLGPIRRMLRDKGARHKEIKADYRRGLPIAYVAVVMGLSSIEAWRTLIGSPDEPVVVCGGSVEERDAALRIIDSKQHRFILEPIALFQLHALDALQAAEATLGRLAIVQTTQDELRWQLAELDAHPDGYMTTFMEGDQLCRRDVSAQEIAHERRRLQSLLAWTRAHCDIVPAVPLADLPPELATKLDKVLGSAAHDTLLAAQGGQFVLVSDDLHLRALAKAAMGADGIWIQPVLMRAGEARHLEQDHYNRSVVSLASWRHNFTSVNSQQLFFAANRGKWKVTSEFEALAATLKLRHSVIQSNLSVCVWFLRQLWKKGAGPTRPQAAKLTRALLKGIDPLNTPNSADYFRHLAGAAQSKQLPERAWRAIREWALAQQQNQDAAK
jgi:tetratricopeptide (TPR) repeat protein